MSVLWSSKNPIYVLLKSSSQKYSEPCCQNDSFKCSLTSKCIPRIPRDRSTFDHQSRKWVSGNAVVWTRTSSHPMVEFFWERRKPKELKMFIVQLFICAQLILLNAQVTEQTYVLLFLKSKHCVAMWLLSVAIGIFVTIFTFCLPKSIFA